MAEVSPPKRPSDHPDRQLDCEEALEAAFQEVAEKAVAAGWDAKEIAMSLVGLAEAHIKAMRENEKTEEAISAARKSVCH